MVLKFLKRKKTKEEKVKLEEKRAEIEKPTEVKAPEIKKDYYPPSALQPKPTRPKREEVGEAYRVLETPHITEKATDLIKQNQYVFKVFPEANKIEIKKAIEDIYGVDVISVKIIKVPARRRRLGRISGWRKGYKKAIVKIKEGQKIEVLPR